MWKLAVVLCLLWPSAAFAGQARAQMQVGMIITGKGSASALRPKTAAGVQTGAAVVRPAHGAGSRRKGSAVGIEAARAQPRS